MIDFTGLNQHLNAQTLNVLQIITPGGRLIGREYSAGDKNGGPGDSFKYNIDKHTGSDFATGETFSDLISLYASIRSISQIDSAKQLSDQFGYHPVSDNIPDFKHYKHGLPAKTWQYHDQAGNVICHIARYNLSATEKIFAPFSLIDGKWQMKHLPVPRPLYNLPALNNHADRPVLITEGEKAADAARSIVQERYAVISWPCGSKSVSKADWSPLKGKRVLIWPDADQSGIEAANDIYKIIHKTAASVKILNTAGLSDGFDAADFEGDWTALREFMKERLPKQPEIMPQVRQDAPQTTNDDLESPIITGSIHAAYEELGIAVNKNGNAICNTDNIMRVLEGCLKYRDHIWYDEFYQRYYQNINGTTSPWSDINDIDLSIMLQRHLGLSQITDGQVSKAVHAYARKHKKNEPRDYFNSLSETDYNPELFLINAIGCEDNEYTRSVSVNLGISICARIMSPGCKHDTMVILEGEQGAKKSMFFEILASKKWYTQTTESVQSKDFYQCLAGKIIVEFAELHAFSKADVTKVKQMLSNSTDCYRVPYGREAEDHPRQSIFCGTTNESEYLKDMTGARRFMPIQIGNIDIKYVQDHREQFFSSCLSLYKQGRDWWTVPQSALDEQEKRRIVYPEEEKIARFIQFKEEISITEILDHLNIPQKDSRSWPEHIGRIMSNQGWYYKQVTRNGVRVRRYFPKNWSGDQGNTPQEVVFND